MSFSFSIFVTVNLFVLLAGQVYECHNYKKLNTPKSASSEGPVIRNSLKCNFRLVNPKKIINPYKEGIQNFVQTKPFGSLCLKCSMCLAIAKELETILRNVSEVVRGRNNALIVRTLQEDIKSLCATGFENYDLRKVQQYKVLTDDFTCNTHVKTQMDGRWTEKLRQMCEAYSNYMDVEFIFYDFLEETNNLASYLCSNNGIFRDCSSLNFQNTSIHPNGKMC